MTGEKRTSVLSYVGIGCASVAVGGIALAIGAGYWLYHTVDRVHREMRDPAIRTQRVKRVLGCREIPAGYHPLMSLSIPLRMDIAVLSDREADFTARKTPFTEKGFFYVKKTHGRKRETSSGDLEGRAGLSEILDRGQFELKVGETIKEGTLPRNDMVLSFTARHGSVRFRGEPVIGIVCLIEMDCLLDDKTRIGIWFGPDPPASPLGRGVDYSGTPADPDAIRSFTSYFSPCAN